MSNLTTPKSFEAILRNARENNYSDGKKYYIIIMMLIVVNMTKKKMYRQTIIRVHDVVEPPSLVIIRLGVRTPPPPTITPYSCSSTLHHCVDGNLLTTSTP